MTASFFACSLLWSIALSVYALDQSNNEIFQQLKEAQRQINNKTQAFCYHGPSGTKNAFIKGDYKQYVNHQNVLVYPFCLMVRELGNRLGNYFHELACAEASGLHFMTVHPQWDITGAVTGNHTKILNHSAGEISSTESTARMTFLKTLPDLIVHPHPADKMTATQKLHHECKCNRYCWQHLHAPWVNRTNAIGQYMKTALTAYYEMIKVDNPYTTLDPEVDISNRKEKNDPVLQQLPLIPDVAIQYRCGDNIAFSYLYGILPFTAFDSRIPSDVRYLYVLSDHPSRAAHSPYTSRCKLILEKLLDYLQERYPKAIIVIKRGGDLFLDMVRLSRAKVMICSASTYCFWPALASEGEAYFPVTSLIAGADSIEVAPQFGPHFHWINEPKIISNFKGIRPWTGIIDILTGKRSPP